MVKLAVSRIVAHNIGLNVSTHRLYIPADLVRDSAYPFKAGDRVLVRVEGGRLVVERSDGGNSRIVQHTSGFTQRLFIPASVVRDAGYPFKIGDYAEVEIVGDRLEIRKCLEQPKKQRRGKLTTILIRRETLQKLKKMLRERERELKRRVTYDELINSLLGEGYATRP